MWGIEGSYPPCGQTSGKTCSTWGTEADPSLSSLVRPSPAPGATGPPLTEEELKRKSESLFEEYLSTLDKTEALTCVRELNSSAFMSQLVEIGLTTMLNSMKDKVSQASLSEVLSFHHRRHSSNRAPPVALSRMSRPWRSSSCICMPRASSPPATSSLALRLTLCN